MSIFHTPLFGIGLGSGYHVDFETRSKLEEEKRLQSGNKIKKLKCCMAKQEELCTLAEVKKIIDKSDYQIMCGSYTINDFTEELYVTIDRTDLMLQIGQFPKNKRDAGINISVINENLNTELNSHCTPESVVEFIKGLAEWLPEYRMIEVKWREEIKKKELACDIAYDVLKRNAEQNLKEKGYKFRVENTHFQFQARIKIQLPKGVEITFTINLLDDFLEDVTKIIDALPSAV